MKAHSAISAAFAVAVLGAGCAQDGSLSTSGFTTSSINPQQTAAAHQTKSDPVCLTLVSQIEALNRDGVTDKVAKAASKKYKMKAMDLAKADELNKANSEFQAKCSNYPPAVTAAAPAAEPEPAKKVAAAKAKPPVPSPKPVASAMATQSAPAVAPGNAEDPAQATAAQP
jgi:hypothetical protein